MISSAKKPTRPLLKRETPPREEREQETSGKARNSDLPTERRKIDFTTFEANWVDEPVYQRNIHKRKDSLVDVKLLEVNEDEEKLTEVLRTPKKLRFDDMNIEERDSDLLINTRHDEGNPVHDIFFDEEAQCICEESIYFKANFKRSEFGKQRRKLRDIYSNVEELNTEIRSKLGHVSAYAWICAVICLASLVDMITSLEDYGEVHLWSLRFEVEVVIVLLGSVFFTVFQVMMSNRFIALEKDVTDRLSTFDGDGVCYRLRKVESLLGRNGFKYRLQVTLGP